MQYPEKIYYNGSIHTGNDFNAMHTALAIGGGKIIASGDDQTIRAMAGSQTQQIDLAGKQIIPAFVDGHAHPLEGQQMVGDIDLARADSAEGVLTLIREAAIAQAEEPWVFVGGIDLSVFGNYPTRQQLDVALPDRPLLLLGHDVHSGCLNTLGLAAAGIGADTQDPKGGIHEREPGSQEPSGVVHEAALYRLFGLIPQLGPARYPQSLAKAIAMAHRLGITGWFDARVDEGLLQAYAAARDAGTLKLHVSAGLLATPRHDPAAQIARFQDWKRRYEGDTLHVHTVKIFIDGVTESRTAALLEPYPGTADHGLALWEQAALNEIVAMADAAGFDLHFHTLADRAVRMALDALEWAAKCNGPRDRRAQLAHLQLVHPDDMPRFSPLGAIASVQALWTAAAPELQSFYSEILGSERAAQSYPLRSLRNAGVMLAGGSDWPVSTMDPLAIMQTGVTHQPTDDPTAEPWNPDERLDLQVMLQAHTLNASHALRFDDCRGLLPGHEANFLILQRSLFAQAIQQLHQTRLLCTVFRGETVYGADTDCNAVAA